MELQGLFVVFFMTVAEIFGDTLVKDYFGSDSLKPSATEFTLLAPTTTASVSPSTIPDYSQLQYNSSMSVSLKPSPTISTSLAPFLSTSPYEESEITASLYSIKNKLISISSIIQPSSATTTPNPTQIKTLQPVMSYFPFDHFMNIPGANNMDLAMYYGCYPNNHYALHRCCSCNDRCWRYGTCCIDQLWRESGFSSPKDLGRYLNMFDKERKKHKATKCQKVIPLDSRKHEIDHVYMVNTCTTNTAANKSLNELCQRNTKEMKNSREYFPVVGNDSYIYVNQYCAKCNGIDTYEPLRLRFRCVFGDEMPTEVETINFDVLKRLTKCVITAEPIDMYSEIHDAIEKCTISNQEHEKRIRNCKDEDIALCNLYQATTKDYNRNPHCRRCVGVDHFVSENVLRCPSKFHENNDRDRNWAEYPTNFYLTLQNRNAVEYVKMVGYYKHFPILEFFDIPLTHTLSMSQNLQKLLCSRRDGTKSECCDCTKDCMLFGRQCCVDVFWNSTKPVSVAEYKRRLIAESDKKDESVCSPVYPPAFSLGIQTYNEMMIRSCKSHASLRDHFLCLTDNSNSSSSSSSSSSIENIIPVRDSNNHNRLYANSYCARCNDVQDFQYVNLTLGCDDNHNMTFNKTANQLRNCTFRLWSQTKSCDTKERKHYNTHCKLLGDQSYTLCRAYRFKLKTHENPHCLKCSISGNQSYLNELMAEVGNTLREENCMTMDNPPKTKNIERFRWSTLLTFTGDLTRARGGKKLDAKTSKACESGHAYNMVLGKCVTLTCPRNYILFGSRCVIHNDPIAPMRDDSNSVSSISSLPGYFIRNRDFRLYVKIPRTCNLSKAHKLFISLSRMFPQNVTFNLLLKTGNMSIFQSSSAVNKDIIPKLRVALLLDLSFATAEIYIGQNTNTKQYDLDFSRLFSSNKICTQPIILTRDEISVKKHENVTRIQYQQQKANLSDVTFWLTVIANSSTTTTLSQRFSVCKGYYLSKPCSRMLLPKTKVIVNNINLKLSFGKIWYHSTEYIPTTGGYEVCFENSTVQLAVEKTDRLLATLYDAEYYIALVGTSVSVVCYTWIISTYVLFRYLRTVPGLNVCFMCVSLFVSDVLFITAAVLRNTPCNACIAIAACMHWSLLSSFFWIIVISYDLLLRFGTYYAPCKDLELKRMKWRSIVAFGLPAVLVGIATTLDQTGSVNIGYGAQGFCWIVKPYARLALYVIPTAIAIILALLAMIYAISTIVKEKRNSQRELQGQRAAHTNFLIITIKLSMILGLTELIGYIQIPHPQSESERNFNSIFGFVYTLTRSLRGIMLWSVYVYGPAVKQCRKRFSGTVAENSTPISRKLNSLQRKGEILSHATQHETCANSTDLKMEMSNLYNRAEITNNNSK